MGLSTLSQITATLPADAAWATGSPSGNTTVALSTATNWFDGCIWAASFKVPASAFVPPEFSDFHDGYFDTELVSY